MSPRTKRPAAPPIPIGTYFAVRQRDGRFAACQVVDDAEGLELAVLAWYRDRVPTLAELEAAEVLIVDHHAWPAHAARIITTPPAPPDAVRVGVGTPRTFEEPCTSYGGWSGLLMQARLQHRWDHELPREAVAGYRAAQRAGRATVTLDLGAGGTTLAQSVSRVVVGDRHGLAAPVSGPVRWEALDALGALTEVAYEGTDASLVAYLASRPLVMTLRWTGHGAERLDLSATQLTRLSVAVAGPLELVLPSSLEHVILEGYRGQPVRVAHPTDGEGLALELWDLDASAPPAVAGLERLSELSLARPREVDVSALGYPELRELTVRGANATLLGLHGLRDLRELRTFSAYDVYGMDPDTFPGREACAALASVAIDGLRKSHASVLKKRLAGVPHLELRGTKSDAWLAVNADNPFNSWVDESPALGKAACKAYREAHKAAQKLGAADRAGLREVVLGLVRAFNRIDAKHGLDTVHRETVYDVAHTLSAASAVDGVSPEEIDAWFDEERDF